MKISNIAIFILFSFFIYNGLCWAQNPDDNTDLAARIGESIVNAQSKSISFTEMALQMIYNGGQNKFLGSYVDPEDYIVGPGDKFTISFVSDQPTDISCEINSDGWVFIKSVGKIQIGPVTLKEAIEKIRISTGELFAGSPFSTQLTEFRFVRVNVSGQVNNPGEFVINPRVDVMQALSMAGGTTAFAALKTLHTSLYQPHRQCKESLMTLSVQSLI